MYGSFAFLEDNLPEELNILANLLQLGPASRQRGHLQVDARDSGIIRRLLERAHNLRHRLGVPKSALTLLSDAASQLQH